MRYSPSTSDDAVHARHPTDVDEQAWLCQPVLHERQEAVAAGQDLRLALVVGQQPQRIVQAHGPEVLELRRDHRRSSPSLPSARTMGADTARDAENAWTGSEARTSIPGAIVMAAVEAARRRRGVACGRRRVTVPRSTIGPDRRQPRRRFRSNDRPASGCGVNESSGRRSVRFGGAGSPSRCGRRASRSRRSARHVSRDALPGRSSPGSGAGAPRG